MHQDLEGKFIGAGEEATFNILKYITHLQYRSLKHFPFSNGIYRQVPIEWIVDHKDFIYLSDSHKKGSIDLFIKANQRMIAVRVQGEGHGKGLKGYGKAQHDFVQKKLLLDYCQVVDIHKRECPNVFKERVNELAIREIVSSFLTSKVEIPII